MSYVAVTFPTTGSNIKTQKDESRAKARKFVNAVGLTESDISSIRAGVFGCILPSDVSADLLKAAAKLGGKVIPFAESTSNVTEGKWVNVGKAVVGTRFEMSGTTPSNPAEGRILPDKYFVLGIQESAGEVYATLGRVDKLGDIGKKTGPGRYVYNVSLDVLRESLATSVAAEDVSVDTKSTDIVPDDATDKTESDRSLDILNMLLENDPHILRANRKTKAAATSDTFSTSADSMSDLIETAMAENKVVYTKEELAEYSAPTTLNEDVASDGDNSLEMSILENLLPGEDQSQGPAQEASEDAPVVATPAPATEVAASDEPDDDEGGLEEDEELDPDTYLGIRQVLDALQESGVDVDSLNDDELEEAVTAYLDTLAEGEDELEEEDDETEADGTDSGDDATDSDKVSTDSDNKAKDDDNKQESADGFEDTGFESDEEIVK